MGLERMREEWRGMGGNPYEHVWIWDEFSTDFDEYPIPGKGDSIVAAIEKHHGLSDGCRVLDIGCGSGQYQAYMALKCGSITGLDLSKKMVSNASARYRKMDLSNVRVLVGD